ncbi:TIM barrel protein [uncultured Roseovarius sp.]|uniref:hydroxypyruvate isomerase family protein n=1 Tax=uncultured Roseovarius sp. TaxID=293344 RepID=UPI00262B6A40|nr:TIM barrel protein [uncultured Roseovarius sp.]
MTQYLFSANTGYLWKELPFLDRIRQAAAHGFAGVEFHDEAQSTDRDALKAVLAETDLPVYGLNVRMGDSFGCAAIPGMKDQARRDVDLALEIAEDIGAGAVHVLGGLTSDPAAHDTYIETLGYALDASDKTILIEPVSAEQLPGFFLRTIDQAAGILAQVNHPRLKILFDCYHIHRESGDVPKLFRAHAGQIGHVQIAAAENRAEPFAGALEYQTLLADFQACGYAGPFGCEYRPATTTEAGLSWRAQL